MNQASCPGATYEVVCCAGRFVLSHFVVASPLGRSCGRSVPSRSGFAAASDQPVFPVFVKAITHWTVCPGDATGNEDSAAKDAWYAGAAGTIGAGAAKVRSTSEP